MPASSTAGSGFRAKGPVDQICPAWDQVISKALPLKDTSGKVVEQVPPGEMCPQDTKAPVSGTSKRTALIGDVALFSIINPSIRRLEFD
jgi:hypothetical protein